MGDRVRALPKSPRLLALELAELAARTDDPATLAAEVAWRMGGLDVEMLRRVITTQAATSATLAARLGSCRSARSGRRSSAAEVLAEVKRAVLGEGSSP
jgi:hypothetical protein